MITQDSERSLSVIIAHRNGIAVLIADFCQVSILIIVICDPVVDASVLLPVMLRRDTVTEVILPVDLVTGWQLDAGNVAVSIIGIGGKCILPATAVFVCAYCHFYDISTL